MQKHVLLHSQSPLPAVNKATAHARSFDVNVGSGQRVSSAATALKSEARPTTTKRTNECIEINV